MRMRMYILSLLALPAFLFAMPAGQVFAQEAVDPFKQICKEAPSGADAPTACKDKSLGGKNPLFGPDGILTKVINILSIVVGIAAVIGIMDAGLKFIRSGDNPQEVSSARDRVLYACIALVIAAAAQLMVRFILYKIT